MQKINKVLETAILKSEQHLKSIADVKTTARTSWYVVNEEILLAFDKSRDNCAPPRAHNRFSILITRPDVKPRSSAH